MSSGKNVQNEMKPDESLKGGEMTKSNDSCNRREPSISKENQKLFEEFFGNGNNEQDNLNQLPMKKMVLQEKLDKIISKLNHRIAEVPVVAIAMYIGLMLSINEDFINMKDLLTHAGILVLKMYAYLIPLMVGIRIVASVFILILTAIQIVLLKKQLAKFGNTNSEITDKLQEDELVNKLKERYGVKDSPAESGDNEKSRNE